MAFVDEAVQNHFEQFESQTEGPIFDAIKDQLVALIGNDVTKELIVTLVGVVKSRAVELAADALGSQKEQFWSVWYPEHRLDKIIDGPGPLDLEVNDARRAFELVFGKKPLKK